MNKLKGDIVPFVPLVLSTNSTRSTNDFRYMLEKGSKKHYCPDCTKNSFVKYIDKKTGDYLPDHYGRCDRESNCGYHLNPYKDGYAKMIREEEQGNAMDWKSQVPKKIKKTPLKTEMVPIPIEVFSSTRQGYEKNVFLQNLLTRIDYPFDVQDIEKVISQYHLGTVTSGYRTGAITFPFIDIGGNVRAIQVKQFDDVNHTTGTDFLHSMIEKEHIRNQKALPEWLKAYKENESKVSCLFGEHLLSKYPYNPVALVEAPKTAIIGMLYFGFPKQPQNLLWLGVYNLSSLNLDKCKALKGRDVYLFPDLSKDGRAFDLWSNKAKEIQKELQGTYFTVSDLLERIAPQQDKEQGKDIADYLIKQDWRLFRTPIVEEIRHRTQERVDIMNCVKSEAIEKSIIEEVSSETTAYINHSDGRLVIPITYSSYCSVYPDVSHYNDRICLPTEFVLKSELDYNQLEIVHINLSSLTIIP